MAAQPQVGAAYRQVSRKEAGMRFLLMQMANAATRQVSDPDRGLELLGTALTSLHTVLTTLRSSPPVEGAGSAATVEASAAAKADLLRLSPAVQEAYGLLALPVPAAVKFLEAVHYEKTPAGDLVLANPERDEVQSAVEGGLNALEWFERQNRGGPESDADQEEQGQFTLGHNPLMMMGGGQALLCCPPHQRTSAPGGKPS
ncbi:uncharacterized protein ACA1_323410 [Acanthamoeba castellanii str. Neff]|uniref:Uncharacterized protein n=1 Tax=Acanthamoeba castellanii (strain ATCC 30010 / Neff) TaxID=1257118 RepID=L8H1N4_ACACF|nr:uncharacterized protein ACA1_323410 [Acanthamoeba castellanii str. Neff]ELR19107.1 hypothetical protein ACA1_323410 [Acanthamoeba castellanii str. Neff]